MSKIYDALRKAEGDKGPFKRNRTPKKKIDVANPRTKMLFSKIDEDFRNAMLHLKNSIDSELKNKQSKVVLFTSSARGEGTTTIAATLARVIALGETDRVLLMDCSVMNPSIHRLFGVENDFGILDLLSEDIDPSKVIKSVDEGVLDIIPIGTLKDTEVMQPLFASEKMGSFIKAVSEKYDYVIIDSSAAINAPETPIIGSFADGIILVIYSGKTKREVIKRAIMMLEKFDGKVIGTVLNRKKYYIPDFIYKRV